MATNRDADILRHIAREEPLTATQEAFGLTRERLTRLLERVAEDVDKLPVRRSVTGEVPVIPEAGRMRVYSDGAARGNPGPAGAGGVLVESNGQVVDRLAKFLGTQTNNFAEYMGLIIGLNRAKDLGVREIESTRAAS